MVKGTENQSGIVSFTDKQFEDLRKWVQSYFEIAALGAISALTDELIERNVWLLNAAGYEQKQIATILHSSQPVVSRILAGKARKRKQGEEKE